MKRSSVKGSEKEFPFSPEPRIMAAGLTGLRRVVGFRYYRELPAQMDRVKKAAKTAGESGASITSRKKGFACLNGLFIKRHWKIMRKSALRTAQVCGAAVCGIRS